MQNSFLGNVRAQPQILSAGLNSSIDGVRAKDQGNCPPSTESDGCCPCAASCSSMSPACCCRRLFFMALRPLVLLMGAPRTGRAVESFRAGGPAVITTDIAVRMHHCDGWVSEFKRFAQDVVHANYESSPCNISLPRIMLKLMLAFLGLQIARFEPPEKGVRTLADNALVYSLPLLRLLLAVRIRAALKRAVRHLLQIRAKLQAGYLSRDLRKNYCTELLCHPID